MTIKTDSRRTSNRALPRDASADQVLEFVFNDEEEALYSEHIVLNHQRDMPAVQEYLREMFELDSRAERVHQH